MAILPVKYPMRPDHYFKSCITCTSCCWGSCWKIFGIWKNRLPSNPFWKLICGLLGWIPTRSIYLWSAVFLDMSLFVTLVTSHILPSRWTSSRVTTISTAAALEVNLLKWFFYQLLNDHRVCPRKWRLVLRLFFAGSWFPPLWIHKITVFTCSLLYKELIRYELLLWYDIHFTHNKFLDKLRNRHVLMNTPKTEYGVRIVLKDASDVLYVLKLEIPGTFKALSIYQDLCTEKCNVIPWMYF